MSPGRAIVASVALAAVLTGWVLALGRTLGALVTPLMLQRPVAELAGPSSTLLALSFALALVAFVVRRFTLGMRPVLAALLLATTAIVGVFESWRAEPVTPLPGIAKLTPMPPDAVVPERDARRPAVEYATNHEGFRGPDVQEKAAGTRRVLVLGDSFVFGMGVDAADTLPVLLQQALAPGVEAVNLGVPGGHLRTHADVLAATIDRLDPDLVLACIVSNDFDGWNPAEERREPRARTGYSFLRFLLGELAAPYARAALFGLATTPDADEHMRRAELLRLLTLTGARGVPLVAFAYTPGDVERLAPLRSAATVVALPALEFAYFIPGDGHPTPAGNRAFAAFLAPLLRDRLGLTKTAP